MPHQAAPQKRIKISLRLKLMATTAFLVGMVTLTFIILGVRYSNQTLVTHTENLSRVSSESLSKVGLSTTQALALNATSPFLDTDIRGVFGLLEPLVRDEEGDILYAYIVATGAETPDNPKDDGRVWAAVAANTITSLQLSPQTQLNFPRPNKEQDLWGAWEASQDEHIQRLPLSLLNPSPEMARRPRVIEAHRDLTTKGGTPLSASIQEYQAAVVSPSDPPGTLRAVLVVGYSMGRIEKEIATIQAQGKEDLDSQRLRIIAIGILTLALAAIIAVLQSLGITRGLATLALVAERLSKGEMNVRAKVQSSDEIGQLARTINTLAERIRLLLRATRDKAVMEKELDIARTIQETLIPDPGLVRRGPLSFSGFFRPASVCGGDFWYHDVIKDNQILLCIGDVTGHGVPSAMISAAAHSSLCTLKNVTDGDLNATLVVSKLNETIYDTARRKLVMTFLAMTFDLSNKCISFSNAGHNFPILLRRDAAGSYKASALVNRGNRLGDLRDSEYTLQQHDLQPDDVILLYTDGITEHTNPQGKEYGERRLRRLLLREAHRTPDELLSILLSDLETFAQKAPQEDDITLVVVRYDGDTA